MPKSEIRLPLIAKAVHEVLEPAGFRPVGRPDWKTRFPRTWRKRPESDLVLEVHLERGTYTERYTFQCTVFLDVKPKPGARRKLEPIVGGVSNWSLSREQNRTQDAAMAYETGLPDEESRRIIQEALRKLHLPRFDTVSTKRAIIECYRVEDSPGFLVKPTRRYFGIPTMREPIPYFDLPVAGDASRRLKDEHLRQGHVSLFVVWTTMDAGCEQGHASVRQLRERFGLEVYGIHTNAFGREPATEQTIRASVAQYDDAYDLCGFADSPDQVRDTEFNRGIGWSGYDLPYIAVVDGEGLEAGYHYGPQITAYEFEETFPALIEEASKLYDWPVPGRPDTYGRGRDIQVP